VEERVVYLSLQIKSKKHSMNKSCQNTERPEAGSLVPVNQVVNAKEKILKKIKYSLQVNTQMLGEQNSLLMLQNKLEWSGQKIKSITALP
jgi:hypothetical protein